MPDTTPLPGEVAIPLPPLPEVGYLGDDVSYGYAGYDMHDYAREAVLADRAQRAAVPADPDKARDFPHNTCPASRHVQAMGEALRDGGKYPMLQEEPAYCAESLLSVVASLYEARSALAASPAAPASQTWQDIATAPEGEMVLVGWLDPEDDEHPERHKFDMLEDGCWLRHEEDREHFLMVAPPESRGPKQQAPYTHWLKLLPIPPLSVPSDLGGSNG